ncbi:MAG: hypothetical protein H7234_03005 [Herminiimonas sp.]|nr:hypothetical protein [Herminiimonas sp.]
MPGGKGPSAPAASGGRGGGGGSTGLPSVGKRGGSAGGSAGNKYFAPEEEDRPRPLAKAPRRQPSPGCARLFAAMCERIAMCERAIGTHARQRAASVTTPAFSLMQPHFAMAATRIMRAVNSASPLMTGGDSAQHDRFLANQRYAKCITGAVYHAAEDLANGAIDNLEQLWQRAQVAIRQGFLAQKGVEADDALAGPDTVFYQRLGMERRGLWLETQIDRRHALVRKAIQQRSAALFGHPVGGSANEWSYGGRRLVFEPHPGEPNDGQYRLEVHSPGPAAEACSLPVTWKFVTIPASGKATDFSGTDRIACMTLVNSNAEADLAATRFSQTAAYVDAQVAFQRAFWNNEPEAILRHAYEAYWRLVRAAPDMRGSAAKACFVLQSALLAKGIALAPVRPGVAPDLEALACTLSEWMTHAPKVFAG